MLVDRSQVQECRIPKFTKELLVLVLVVLLVKVLKIRTQTGPDAQSDESTCGEGASASNELGCGFDFDIELIRCTELHCTFTAANIQFPVWSRALDVLLLLI